MPDSARLGFVASGISGATLYVSRTLRSSVRLSSNRVQLLQDCGKESTVRVHWPTDPTLVQFQVGEKRLCENK